MTLAITGHAPPGSAKTVAPATAPTVNIRTDNSLGFVVRYTCPKLAKPHTYPMTVTAKAGARYLVTPGCTDRLLAEVDDTGLPCLPGVSTVSEAMRLAERGLRALKFFPAEPSGGVPYLKALAGPLPDLRFCPTGGISPDNAPKYLVLPNVRCVGGSWLAPKGLLAAGAWGEIETLARQAADLR